MGKRQHHAFVWIIYDLVSQSVNQNGNLCMYILCMFEDINKYDVLYCLMTQSPQIIGHLSVFCEIKICCVKNVSHETSKNKYKILNYKMEDK